MLWECLVEDTGKVIVYLGMDVRQSRSVLGRRRNEGQGNRSMGKLVVVDWLLDARDAQASRANEVAIAGKLFEVDAR